MLNKPESCRGCPLSCSPLGSMMGYVPASGSGDNGVLVVLEAAGEHEVAEGMPTVSKAGYFMWQNLKRVGIEREGFRIHNVLSCRPPDNKLANMPYEAAAIKHCEPNLDTTIHAHVAHALSKNKTPVIVALGKISVKRVMGTELTEAQLKLDYQCYALWNNRYKCWVIAADHPSYLMRGKTELLPILQFAFQRALEIAENGIRLDAPKFPDDYLLNPTLDQFTRWVEEFEAYYAEHPDLILSYDIETPHKKGASEDELEKDDDDYVILQCSFSYIPGKAASVQWNKEYMPLFQRLFASECAKCGWNCPTPDQKILKKDLTWVRAGDLKVGDELVALDEYVPNGHRLRKYKTSIVTHAQPGIGRIFRVTFSDGSTVKVTDNHPWLIAQRNRTKNLRKKGGSSWVPTTDLIVGQKIQRLVDMWEEDTTKEAGYLAGFFDGEGHISNRSSGWSVGAAQNSGDTLNRVLNLLAAKSYTPGGYYPNRSKDNHCYNFEIKGGVNKKLHFLGSIRPQRLLSKFEPEMMGAVWNIYTPELQIVSIDDLGLQEIVQLSTSTHTYILEGFAAHNSNAYDNPRIQAQLPMHGELYDGMQMWHVLNSSLPKGLGFVTPFYVPTAPLWKYLGSDAVGLNGAYYNAMDSDMALRNVLGIMDHLKKSDLWDVYKRHMVDVHRVFSYMSEQGVPFSGERRLEAELLVSGKLKEINKEIQAAVPQKIHKYKVFKKAPKDVTGLIQIPSTIDVPTCSCCHERNIKASHFKSIGKAKLSICSSCGEKHKKKLTYDHEFVAPADNPCMGSTAIKAPMLVMSWARYLPFKISKKSLMEYQAAQKHVPVREKDKKTGLMKVVFHEKAIIKLQQKYPEDALYKLILEFRGLQKLLGQYIGVTKYIEVEVPDDYILQDGEKWADAICDTTSGVS